ncbi:hypothetical protein PGTUg99_022020 [Puccinia graminis f. sp. tritici]|uniref:Uncharacterized protein n=1 Tax=Puccinia graminis f. sp. tritici TaxID=56615 RepID=A0A5B0QU37_PUCGR|nr:hypothetical protein PGTUg99_022020 [Puccinia graminis f. sp. tritici]
MDQAGLADHQARVAPSKPNLAWIQPSLGTSPIWSGSDPSHAWPSPSEGATHAKPDLTVVRRWVTYIPSAPPRLHHHLVRRNLENFGDLIDLVGHRRLQSRLVPLTGVWTREVVR